MVPDVSGRRGPPGDGSPAGNAVPVGGLRPSAREDAAVPVYALLGWPLRHSLSPVLHAAAFAAAGLPGRYELRPTAPGDLPAAIEALKTGSLAGANVTAPHKMAVRDLVDAETALVSATGAVNAIARSAAGLYADNTDIAGFAHALGVADLTRGRGRQAVVLGTGGAARAVAYVLAGAGYRVAVLGRSVGRASVAVSAVHRAFPGAEMSSGPLMRAALPEACRAADLLVQCTTVGSEPDEADCLWPPGVPLPASMAVVDVIAWPPETALVQRARASGARAMGGLAMLLGQAAASWQLWTGLDAPLEEMRSALTVAAGVEFGMR